MAFMRTGVARSKSDCTSGDNVSNEGYADGGVYEPKNISKATSSRYSSVNYVNLKSEYRVSTEQSRIRDTIAGFNSRLKKIDP